MNLKYFIIKGKKKYLSIYVRFWDSNRIDQKTKTGFSVLFEDWSDKKQRIKIRATTDNIDFINDKLSKLETYIIDQYNKDFNNKNHISNSWLKEKVSNFFGRVDENEEYKFYFVSWIEKFVEQAPKRLHRGRPIKPRSIKNYEAALNKLKAFETHQKKRYRFEDVNLTFHQEFINYCRDIESLNNNSIGNIINRIKTFCREIELEGFDISPQYKSNKFISPKNETYNTYLNEKEIQQILKHDFSDSERLDNTRDLFVIGLRTGLRVSDILRLSKKNMAGEVINITPIKTGINLTIPIHPDFKKILKKRAGEFPNSISEQKFNKYIKEVCKEAGVKTPTFGSKKNPETKRVELKLYPKHELITSHSCRRSFATNLFLAGIENRVIMRATGHRSEKQFLEYVKASQDEHVKMISDYWEKQSENEF